MIKFLLGIVIGICFACFGAYLFVALGGVNMATASKPFLFERRLAHRALAVSIGKAADDKSPVAADEATFVAGAKIYEQNCAGCHGAYGKEPSPFSKRVYPHIPPLLPPSKGVTDDPVGETHWVVENGIRFSAMPSFAGKLSETELWQVSEMLHSADSLPPAVQDQLRGK
jgi:mono/diheme cytochrome c family protein